MHRRTDPFPDSDDAKLSAEFERLTARTAAALEFRLSQVVVATGGLALVLLAVARAGGADVLPTAWITTLLFMAWYGASWFLVRTDRYRPWMRWIATTLDTSLATFLFVTDALGQGPLRGLVGSGPVIYVLAVVATTLRLDPGLALYSGISGALQFLLAAHLVVLPMVPEAERAAPEFAAWLVWLKAAFVLAAGLMARAAGRRMRRVLTQLTWDAVEKESLRSRFGEQVVEGLLVSSPPGPGTVAGASKAGMTVCVAGLAGFAKVSSGQRPEDAAALRAKFVDLVLDVAQREGGRVDRFLSDGVLAVFEGPDDVARALRASRELATRTKRDLGGKRQCEVGLERVSDGDDRSPAERLSDALNVAGRLRDECPRRKRTVLFTRAVFELRGTGGEAEELGWSEVEGLRELIPVYALKDA